MTAGPASCSTVELQPLPLRFANDALAVPHQLAVDPGRSDARMECGALERRPRALRQHVLAAHGERCVVDRSEEHTSELQSLMRISYAVFCLKKKKITSTINN